MILSKRATEIKQFMDSSHAIAQNLSEEDAERLQKTIEQDEDVERYGSGIFLGAGMDERFGFSVEVRYADEIWQKVLIVCQLQEDCRRKKMK